MVDHCVTIEDRDERTRCAYSIVNTMADMVEHSGDEDDFRQKLWNHLARISQYKLDVDFPVEIEAESDEDKKRQRIAYPQRRIRRRHYGAILESLTKKVMEIEDEDMREELAEQVANQMKRSLAYWDIDVMSDAKVAEDLADYTDGMIQLDPDKFQFVSDGELLSNLISTSITKKKKKK